MSNRGKPGKFIVIEGIDGAGTTTQANLLAQKLRDDGLDVMQTAEPSEGPIGQMIRSILSHRLTLPDAEGGLNQRSLALLCAAERLDHLNTLIKPVLAAGIHVICDRYSPSTYAYQGVDGDEDMDAWIGQVDSKALTPDSTIYLRIPFARDAIDRICLRGKVAEIFEKEEFLDKVIKRYDTYMGNLKKALKVNALLDPDMIAHIIWDDTKKLLI